MIAQARTSWFDEVRAAAPDVLDVAAALGLTVSRRRFGPCPACGKEDRRHAALTPRHGGRGWMCAHCKETGDALRLAAWVVTGGPKPDAAGWDRVRGLFAAQGWCSGEAVPRGAWTPPPVRAPVEVPFPDPVELRGLLRACRSVGAVPDVQEWCRGRGFGGAVPAAVLPDVYPWPAWWPFRGRPWRLVVSMVDASGAVRSMHGRATEETDRGKTRWPLERRAGGLLFADPRTARPMLTGKGEASRIVVVEGITDYLAVASRAPAGTAVLGACSGGFAALGQARITAGAVVYAATDPDAAGERYAGEIAAAFRGTGRDVRRVAWDIGVKRGERQG